MKVSKQIQDMKKSREKDLLSFAKNINQCLINIFYHDDMIVRKEMGIKNYKRLYEPDSIK